jgi:diguanylate cyclase (GGDEF)-like protein/PAS domain S-box-containing protein
MKVLIVEDDRVTLQILCHIVKQRGHIPVQASSAEDAKGLYTAGFFPLVILDLNLPGIDGLEFSRWVREQPNGDCTYILVGTAAGESNKQALILNQILEAGSDDYIAKPYTPDLLHVRLTIAETQIHEFELRKKLEIALKQERDFISAVFDTAAVLIIVMNLDQQVIHMNAAVLSLTEMDLDSRPRFPDALIPPEDTTRVNRLLEELKTSTQAVTFETFLFSHKGDKHYISWTATLTSSERVDSTNIVCSGIDITDRYEAEERLAFLATRDPLTHFYNRNYLHEAMASFLQKARENLPCCLLCIDLDDFKIVNDSAGHAAGDRLLIAIAGLLKDSTRLEDVIVRFGGDEFIILLSGADIDQGQRIADRIRTHIDEFIFYDSGRRFSVSASVGLITIDPELTAEQIIARADAACYKAKSNGRNRTEIYTPNDATIRQMHADANWKERIKEALQERLFELWFQPVMNLATHEITYHETLIRLREPSGELVMPMAFLPSAERFKIITHIDRYVIKYAARYLMADLHLNLAINLSGQSITEPTIVDWILQCFEGVPDGAKRTNFEITETAVVSNLAAAREIINKLRNLGFQFALDDFGSGFSSFQYLQGLPIDYLKIDGSFIHDLPTQPMNRSFVHAINEMAHQLKIKSVVERVEDEATLQILREMNVDFVQGYLIGEPVYRPLASKGGTKTQSLSLGF